MADQTGEKAPVTCLDCGRPVETAEIVPRSVGIGMTRRYVYRSTNQPCGHEAGLRFDFTDYSGSREADDGR